MRTSGGVYGTFAPVVAVLAVLYLAARIFLYGAALCVVLRGRFVSSQAGNDQRPGDQLAHRTASDSDSEGRMAAASRTYYVIDSHLANPPNRLYRVWQRTGASASAVLVGQFDSLDEAKGSVDAAWRDPTTKLIEALGFSGDAEGQHVAAEASIAQTDRVAARSSHGHV